MLTQDSVRFISASSSSSCSGPSMRSYSRPSQITDHPATSTSGVEPSNDSKTETIVESLCREPENIWVLGKSHRLTKNINMLPDNVLLRVFDFYRMYPESRFPPRIGTSWKWHELVHVCQRWRSIIFGSPRRLNLQLICTRGTPVRKNLGCWPAFPIAIDFYCDVTSISELLDHPDEEDNVIAALEHPDRVCRIGLHLTPPQLQKLSTAIQEPFPALTVLRLAAFWGNVPVLSDAFLGGSAPRLQSIYLDAIAFPALPTLLLSTSDLVELHLRQIPETGYISPNTVVAFLATLTRLESLQIGFQSPPSRHSPGHFHPTRTVLPTLTKFMFLGTSEYLEDLVAQIDTPRLKYLNTTYFNQLDFQVSQLSQFLRRQELIHPTRLNDAHIEFCYFDVSIGLTSSQQPLSPSSSPKGPGLNLTILSGGLDQQTSRLTQVLTQCFAILSGVDQLFICDRRSSRPDQEDGILNDTEWLGFFSLFTDVKSLLLSEGIARHVTRALDGSTSEAVAEALPALRQLQIWPTYPSTASVEQFTSLRRLSSQPITIVDTQRKFDREFRSFFTKRGESSG